MDESGDQSDEQQATEKPIGVEEQRTIESQEAQAEEERSTEDVEPSPITTEIISKAQEKEQREFNTNQNVNEKRKPKPRDAPTKLFDQFSKHFQVSKIASGNTTNMLKQIQKQLTQIDKSTSANNKQEAVIKQLVVQVKTVQKQLDKISRSVDRIKNVPNVTRKGAKNNHTKKRDSK